MSPPGSGWHVNDPGKLSTPIAEISTAKALFNSVISMQDGRFAVFDLIMFYLGMPTKWYEYTIIHISTIPESIIAQYNLLYLVNNGYILV
jgi:hypothetical protein